MAFINGWKTRWECPICGFGCAPKLRKRKPGGKAEFIYVHAEDIKTEINGHTVMCPNSGKKLLYSEVKIVHEPNTVSYSGTCA